MTRRGYLLWAGAFSLLLAAAWTVCLPGWSTQPLGLPAYTGPVFAIIGLLRLRAAYRAGRIKAAIRSSSPLRFAVAAIPRQAASTYAGHGFEWTRAHTERLHELSRREPAELQWITSPLGGSPLVHGVGGDRPDRPLFLSDRQLAQHTLILGTTGVGKTRLFELLILQAIRRGEAVVILDPKGDDGLLGRVVAECRRGGSFERFLLFAPPYPDHSATYDPLLNYVRVSEIPDRIAPLIPGGGNSESFRKFSWGAINIIAHALAACGEPISLTTIRRYALDNTWELVRLFLVKNYREHIDVEMSTADEAIGAEAAKWLVLAQRRKVDDSEELRRLIALARRPRDNYQKMTNSLIPILDSLSTGPMRGLLSPVESQLDWHRLAALDQVAYLFLGSMLGHETANAVAKMAMMDFQSFVGATYAYRETRHHRPINLFVDELSNVINPEFVNLLNKGRGAGLRITMAAQTGSDLEAALGSRAMAQQVIGNANTVIQLRAQSYQDARAFADLCGKCSINALRTSTSVRPAFGLTGKRDVADFDASYGLQQQETEVDLVPPSAITDLPIGQFFGRWQGRVYKGRIPLIAMPEQEDFLVALGVKS